MELGSGSSQPEAISDEEITKKVCEALKSRMSTCRTTVYVRMTLKVFLGYWEKNLRNAPFNSKETKYNRNCLKLVAVMHAYFRTIRGDAVTAFRTFQRTYGLNSLKILAVISTLIVRRIRFHCEDGLFKDFASFSKIILTIDCQKRIFDNCTKKVKVGLLLSTIAVYREKNLYGKGFNRMQRRNRALHNQGGSDHSLESPDQIRKIMGTLRLFYKVRNRVEGGFEKLYLSKQEFDGHSNRKDMMLNICAEADSLLKMVGKTGQPVDEVLPELEFCTLQLRKEKKEENGTVEYILSLRPPCDACETFVNEGNSIHQDEQLAPVVKAVQRVNRNIKAGIF